MPAHTYTQLDLVGTSAVGVEDAITSCLTRAAKTLTNLDWFEVVQVRGRIVDGVMQEYQVELKLGLRVLDPTERHAPQP
jgi:dodecin